LQEDRPLPAPLSPLNGQSIFYQLLRAFHILYFNHFLDGDVNANINLEKVQEVDDLFCVVIGMAPADKRLLSFTKEDDATSLDVARYFEALKLPVTVLANGSMGTLHPWYDQPTSLSIKDAILVLREVYFTTVTTGKSVTEAEGKGCIKKLYCPTRIIKEGGKKRVYENLPPDLSPENKFVAVV
jgi:NAD kinase